MELIKLLGEAELADEGVALVHDILFIQGRLRYLDDWDEAIRKKMATVTPPKTPPVVRRPHARTGKITEHKLVIEHRPAGTQRQFDYDGLLRREPGLYQRSVRLIPAASPLSITFPASTAWSGLRSVGWQAEATLPKNVDRTSVKIFNLPDQARFLSELRVTKGKLEDSETEKRVQLATMINNAVVFGLGIALPGALVYRDADFRLRASKPKRQIDLDAAAQHPTLKQYLKTNPCKAYTLIRFDPLAEDPEGDNENEDARGIWK